jgi:hypothetical protein
MWSLPFLPFICTTILLSKAVCVSATAALSVPPSASWYGDDGSWSAVSIRVGTPEQWMDVMVSTASSETWVIGPGGCDDSMILYLYHVSILFIYPSLLLLSLPASEHLLMYCLTASTCATQRGGLFDQNSSSTWKGLSYYQVGIDANLGSNVYADYGLDTLVYGSEGHAVSNSIIGSITSTKFWLGSLGLGIIPGSFNSTQALGPIGDLYAQRAVPSRSYGYTAGAKYRRFAPSSVSLFDIPTDCHKN